MLLLLLLVVIMMIVTRLLLLSLHHLCHLSHLKLIPLYVAATARRQIVRLGTLFPLMVLTHLELHVVLFGYLWLLTILCWGPAPLPDTHRLCAAIGIEEGTRS